MDRLQELLADGVIDEVYNQLKSGKEAEVWLVSHRGEPVAAKIYKAREFRSFKNDAGYKEGRQVRNTRTQRAMNKGSKFGREAAEEAWKSAEADAMFELHAAGVRVPKPVLFYEGVLLMEVIGDAEGRVAPRLVDAGITLEQAGPMYLHLRAEIIKILAADWIHGDLSEFNILLGKDGPVIIDFPQVVTAAKNSRSEQFFRRDIGNMLRFFSGFDPSIATKHASDPDEIWRAYVRRDLSPHFVPSGRAFTAPRGGPQQGRGPQQGGRNDQRGPGGRNDQRGPRVEQRGGPQGPRVEPRGGPQGPRVEQRGGPQGPRVEQRGGPQGPRVEQRGGPQGPRVEQRGGPQGPRVEQRGAPPSPLVEQRGGQGPRVEHRGAPRVEHRAPQSPAHEPRDVQHAASQSQPPRGDARQGRHSREAQPGQHPRGDGQQGRHPRGEVQQGQQPRSEAPQGPRGAQGGRGNSRPQSGRGTPQDAQQNQRGRGDSQGQPRGDQRGTSSRGPEVVFRGPSSGGGPRPGGGGGRRRPPRRF